MHEILHPGIPTLGAYARLLKHADFSALERFSNRFLQINRALLGGYARRWTRDPLHQWSRQWEYPFMVAAIRRQTESGVPLRVLDAGSGMTFFPYFLLQEFGNVDVHCCDIDGSLGALYASVAPLAGRAPEFRACDLCHLQYESSSFDVVYSVSVLEHLKERSRVIGELARVLRPGGELVISFDISPDGARDISPAEVERMLQELARHFQGVDQLRMGGTDFSDPDTYFNTRAAAALDPSLLPWIYPSVLYQIRSLVSGCGWPSWPPLLTVACGVLRKPVESVA